MKSYKRHIFGLVLALFIMIPVAVFAQGGVGTGEVKGIENPLACENCDDLGGAIIAISEKVAEIGFYVVAIFIIYSGFLFVKARGNKDELKKAKESFLYTVIGAAILLGATVLANVIKGTVDDLKKEPTPKTEVLK